MTIPEIHTWKKVPFLRLLLPLVAGILMQWHVGASFIFLCVSLVISFLGFTFFSLLPFVNRFRFSGLAGLFISWLFFSLGGLITRQQDIRMKAGWFGHHYHEKDWLQLTLQENPVEKTKSFKANASVDFAGRDDSVLKTCGTIILYFKKDSLAGLLEYGSRIVIKKRLQEIKNSGNPGGFNYKQYSLFHGITHQVYLKENEYEIQNGKNQESFKKFIFYCRQKVLNILRTYIKGEKEAGLAEALLIGYKDDLDKTLVQSYSNTGVVHVIAISGLHVGLIYWLLLQLFRPLQKNRRTKWIHALLILAGLWLFSLLAGAQPSVIRSAVMFTCIVLGSTLKRNPSVLNTLAFSAFLLLCYNPFWLWDVGFQLSYAAVLSIVLFMQPIYHWFYFKNKILDFTWKLNAVTIAAQILTSPVSIYHFHQFPISFLLTNFLAVPLSSLILLGEIGLCVLSVIPSAALIIGKIISGLIWLMNSFIERIEKLPYSLWDGLQISILQAIFLVAVVAGLGFWLMEKNKTGLKYALVALLAFAALRSGSFIQAGKRQQLIVYNVPQKQAIDFIDGRRYFFAGDSDLLTDDFIRNFHIKPSRVLHRIEPGEKPIPFSGNNNLFSYQGSRILIIHENSRYQSLTPAIPVDLLILSGNPRLSVNQLAKTFLIKQMVFDGSCPAWKVNYWKRDCDSLKIPAHDVKSQGAYVNTFR
jgi:competence protein ComEC